MPSYCCVPYCRACSKRDKISFHQIPSDTNRRLLWLKAIPRQDPKDLPWMPNQWTAVCQKHFKREDFKQGPLSKKRMVLKNDAVPSIFPVCPTNFQTPAKESSVRLELKNTAVQPSYAPVKLENDQNLQYDPAPSSLSTSSSAMDFQLSDTRGTRDLPENQTSQIIGSILSDAFSNYTDIEL